jgi:hypothetical protein
MTPTLTIAITLTPPGWGGYVGGVVLRGGALAVGSRA